MCVIEKGRLELMPEVALGPALSSADEFRMTVDGVNIS
jgi:hypothetical protein